VSFSLYDSTKLAFNSDFNEMHEQARGIITYGCRKPSQVSEVVAMRPTGAICVRGKEEVERLITDLKLKGCSLIVGVDEAGRGPIAGPVVAAAVYMPDSFSAFDELKDSKVMSAVHRQRLYKLLRKEALISIGMASPKEIDKLNIRRATLLAMKRAIAKLGIAPDVVLIDGDPIGEMPYRCVWVIKGDEICPPISAASIVAKVVRDRWMMRMHKRYPQYGFDSHKGYATPMHKLALLKWGPCPIHRLSFSPVKEALLPKLPCEPSEPSRSNETS
jgi:ribonuclease HII